MPPRKIVAANWKMNDPPDDFEAYQPREGVDVIVCPAHGDIRLCVQAGLRVGGQCGRPEPKGANTGDTSMKMLKGYGSTYVLCGHSERRRDHSATETDESVGAQAKAAMEQGLHPIVCVGETLEEYNAKRTQEVIRRQLQAVLAATKDIKGDFSVAYEPRWAIGSGKTPTMEEIEAVHAFIHKLLSEYGRDTRVLYGGSVDDTNAGIILRVKGVNGALVGGASLKPKVFRAIVDAAGEIKA